MNGFLKTLHRKGKEEPVSHIPYVYSCFHFELLQTMKPLTPHSLFLFPDKEVQLPSL